MNTRSKSNMKLTLSALCPEVKLLILNYLEIDELLTLSLVSKSWYQFVSSDIIWHERFRRFNAKLKPLSPLPPDSDDSDSEESPRQKRKTSSQDKSNAQASLAKQMYKISKTPNAKQLREVKASKFLSVNKVKLAFFLNKTGLLFNRFAQMDDITRYTHSYVNYFSQDDEDLVWNNYDERFQENTRFKVYHIGSGSGCGYKVIHLLQCYLAEQIIDAGVRYAGFLSSQRFLLCLVHAPSHSIIHVYRFSHETGQFKLTHKLDMSPDSVSFSSEHIFLNDKESSLIVFQTEIWVWNLLTGKRLGKGKVSEFVKPSEKLREIFPVGARGLALLVDYHTKRYVQQKVIMLDLASQRKLWETKLNCLQSFMKLQVTSQFVIVLRNKKTEDFQLSFVVYDVDTGSKLYEVPYQMDYHDFRGWFFPKRGDIMVVLSETDGFFYYDLRNQETLFVSFQTDASASSSDSSSEEDEYDDFYSEDRKLSLCDGPGETIIQCVPTTKGDMAGHEMVLRLVDYRHNRSVRMARFEGLKIWRHQVGWDQHLSHFVEYYDHHICGTNVYRIW